MVLDAGRIVETGTHAQLLALGGIYQESFTPWARHSTPRLASSLAEGGSRSLILRLGLTRMGRSASLWNKRAGDGRCMIEFKKRIYIENCCGLCNRLEMFVLASAIQRAHGHQIFLGWPELDVLRIEGTRRGTPGLLGRWGAVRLRACDLEAFEKLAGRNHIILRGLGGPAEKMAPIHLESVSKIHLRAPLAEAISAFFRELGPRPVVGVHLRQGDFRLLSEDAYDLNQAWLSAVPLWWHEWVMDAIVQRQPDVRFLVCQTKAEQAVATLRKNFEIVELPIGNPYRGTPATGRPSIRWASCSPWRVARLFWRRRFPVSPTMPPTCWEANRSA